MPRAPAAGKYASLVTFLIGRSVTTQAAMVSLAEIEQLIGGPLPAGAFKKTWWMTPRTRERWRRPWIVAG
jgi:hypothetical protein